VPDPTLERESALWAKGFAFVAGLDEVGRGPLAGPVVAAAVVFSPGQSPIEGLKDSKLMTPAERERVAAEVRVVAHAWAVGAASVREIDRINIRRASALAMRRALDRLEIIPDHILIDGTSLPELGAAHEPVVGGDSICQSVSAAAVLAKCVRDRLMERLAPRYPQFHWEANKGYATAEHLAALKQCPPTRHHRVSFSPMAQLELLEGAG
jgi:ribonuclease HII